MPSIKIWKPLYCPQWQLLVTCVCLNLRWKWHTITNSIFLSHWPLSHTEQSHVVSNYCIRKNKTTAFPWLKKACGMALPQTIRLRLRPEEPSPHWRARLTRPEAGHLPGESALGRVPESGSSKRNKLAPRTRSRKDPRCQFSWKQTSLKSDEVNSYYP